MAFLGVLLANLLFLLILGSTFIALVFFIISMVLFLRNRIQRKKGDPSPKKVGAIVTLVLCIIFLLPLIVTVTASSIASVIYNQNEKAAIEAIENKVFVKKGEWKSGFEYHEKRLVPVNIFINSDYFRTDNEIGALVIENTNRYYSLYQLENDSGYDIYYVWVESFANGVYYTRAFVDAQDYDSVLQYYDTADLEIGVLWKSAPQDTEFTNVWQYLDLSVDGYRDALLKLTHEVLDDVSSKRQVNIHTYSDIYEDNIEFVIQSSDGVFTVQLTIYTKDDEIRLYLNGYQVEDQITEKYRDMLLHLINASEDELLKRAAEME